MRALLGLNAGSFCPASLSLFFQYEIQYVFSPCHLFLFLPHDGLGPAAFVVIFQGL